MIQEFVVIMIVLAAVSYIGRCAWSAFRGKTACGGCGGGCGKTPTKTLLSIQPSDSRPQ